VIAYYAHHHGAGHLLRANAVAEHLDEPVALLSSLRPPDGHAFAEVVDLPMDDGGLPSSAVLPGLAHFAPEGSPGLATRMARIAGFLAAHAPATLVVDVSVEVALLGRLLGARVLVVRQHGDRDDEPHRQAYRAAARLLAPWPRALDRGASDAWARHTTWTGGFSRLQGRPPQEPPGDGSVVLLGGRGGGEVIATAAHAIRGQDPGRRVVVLGPAGAPLPGDVEQHEWVEDPWPHLQAADVVVATASQNSVMDAAAAGRPLVVLAAPRPFDEQETKARRLHAAGLARHVAAPATADWPAVLHEAIRSDPRAGGALLAPDGARSFARAVGDHARAPGTGEPIGTGVSVCTLAHGRLDHLARQHASLLEHAPEAEHVVAWMGGPDPAPAAPGARVVEVAHETGAPLPLAAARNAAIAAATGGVVVLLDVDCVVGAGTVQELADAARETGGVVLPRVRYVPAGGGPAAEHPARRAPDPAAGRTVPCEDWGLAWTVGLALPTTVATRVGGFDEGYTGYGAEDTDFAWRCRAAGVPLHWAPAAELHHLPHPGSGVPYDRADDVVRNAIRFQRVWGHWPMRPWLRAFADAGLLSAELTAVVFGDTEVHPEPAPGRPGADA